MIETSAELVRLSASQTKTFDLCGRKWAFEKIDHIVSPTSPAAQFGIDGHKELEEWFVNRVLPGPVAKQNIRGDRLPNPAPDLMVEQYFEREMPEIGPNVLLLGYIDIVQPPRPDSRPMIYDHKFTSSLKYALSDDELREDLQAVIYGKIALESFGAAEVGLRWNYFEYRKATGMPTGSRKAEAVLTPESIQSRWERVVEIGKQIVYHKRNTKRALDVLPDPTACQAFGGCVHRSVCNITPEQALAAHMRQFEKFNGGEEEDASVTAATVFSSSHENLALTTKSDSDITFRTDASLAPTPALETVPALERKTSMNFAKLKSSAPTAPAVPPTVVPPVAVVPPPAPTTAPAPSPAPAVVTPAAGAPVSTFATRLKAMQATSGATGVNPPESALPPAPALVPPVATAPAPAVAPPTEVPKTRKPRAPKAATAAGAAVAPEQLEEGTANDVEVLISQAVTVASVLASAGTGTAEHIATRSFEIVEAIHNEATKRYGEIPF